MEHVFVSYSRTNKEFIKQLRDQYNRLKEPLGLNFELWIDEERITTGREWTAEIDINIRESFAVLLLITKTSLDSWYVSYEWALGVGAGKFLLPVLLERTELPLMLQKKQYQDFTNGNQNWEALFKALRQAQRDVGDEDDAELVRIAARRLREALTDAECRDAVEVLGRVAHQPKAVDELNRTLNRSRISTEIKILIAEKLLLTNTPASLKPLLTSEAVPVLTSVLNSRRDRDVRMRAAYVLMEIDTEQSLMAILRTALEPYRSTAIQRLIERENAALPIVLYMLEQNETPLRSAAIHILGKLGVNSESVIEKLARYVTDLEASIQQGAAEALLSIGTPAAVTEVLRSYDPVYVNKAASWLVGYGDVCVPFVARLLEQSEGAAMETAADVLVRMGNYAVGRLMSLLENRNLRPEVRCIAAASLARIKNPNAVYVLENHVADPVRAVRLNVMNAIGEIAHPDGINALARALDDGDVEVRLAAVQALGKIRTAEAVQRLFLSLSDQSVQVRMTTISLLADIGDPEAIASLIDMTHDAVHDVRTAAEDALLKFDNIDAYRVAAGSSRESIRKTAEHRLLELDTIDSLEAITHVGSAHAKLQAVEAVKRYGTVATNVLLEALQAEQHAVRRAAVLVLGEVGGTQAVGILTDHLSDTHSGVREAIARALGAIGVPAVVDPLLRLLGDSNDGVRAAAVDELKKFDKSIGARLVSFIQVQQDMWWAQCAAMQVLEHIKYAGALNMLINLLSHTEADVREQAALTLAAVPDARAVKSLTARLTDEDTAVQRAVVRALQVIGTPDARRALQQHRVV